MFLILIYLTFLSASQIRVIRKVRVTCIILLTQETIEIVFRGLNSFTDPTYRTTHDGKCWVIRNMQAYYQDS